jgi:hypothetical protein
MIRPMSIRSMASPVPELADTRLAPYSSWRLRGLESVTQPRACARRGRVWRVCGGLGCVCWGVVGACGEACGTGRDPVPLFGAAVCNLRSHTLQRWGAFHGQCRAQARGGMGGGHERRE